MTPAVLTTRGETTRPTSKQEAAHATLPRATCFSPHGTCSSCGFGVQIINDLAGSNMETGTDGGEKSCPHPCHVAGHRHTKWSVDFANSARRSVLHASS